MFHFFKTVTDGKGNALPNWQVELVELGTTTVVPIYADENETPISTVSGIANRALADEAGNADGFVADGKYSYRFYNAEGKFQKAERFVPMYGAGYAGAEADRSEEAKTQAELARDLAQEYADQTAADAVQTGLDSASTAADVILTNADVILSGNAASAAIAAGNYFVDEATALAATTDGDFYFIPDGDALALYLNDTGAAVDQSFSLAGAAAVSAAITQANAAKNSLLSVADATVLVDDNLSDSDPLTTTNIQDASAFTGSVTFDSDGVEIVSTPSRLFEQLTDESITTKRKLVVLAETVTVPVGSNLGITISDGTDRAVLTSVRAGSDVRFNWTNSKTSQTLNNTIAGLPLYVAGDVMKITIVSDPYTFSIAGCGAVTVHWQIGDTIPIAFRFFDVPLGKIGFAQNNNTTKFSQQKDGITSVDQPSVDAFSRYVRAQALAGVAQIALPEFVVDAFAAQETVLPLFEVNRPAVVPVEMLQGYKFYKNGRNFWTDAEPKQSNSETDPEVMVYHVDFQDGVDTNDASEGAPIKNAGLLHKRVGHGARVIIKCRGTSNGDTCFGSTGETFSAPSAIIDVIAWGDDWATSAKTETATLSWTDLGGGVYQTTLPTSCSGVVDNKFPTPEGNGNLLRKETSVAAVTASLEGSRYVSGSQLTVRTVDGRLPDSDVVVYRKATSATDNNNLVFSGHQQTVFVQKIRCDGGVQPLFYGLTNALCTMNIMEDRVIARYGEINSRGTSCGGTMLTKNSEFYEANNDAESWKSLFGTGITGSEKLLIIRQFNKSLRSGRDAEGTNNVVTPHKGCLLIDIGGDDGYAQDWPYHAVNDIIVWRMGGRIGPSLTAGRATVRAGNTATDTTIIVLDSVDIEGNGVVLEADAAATIYHRDCTLTGGTNGGAGTVATY